METMTQLNEAEQRLALDLFDIGAIQFGAFKLKLHETNPDAPRSPIYLNLRTPDNPKPGPLTPEIMEKIGKLMYQKARSDGVNRLYLYVVGIPNAGDPFAAAYVDEERSQVGKNVPILLHMKKEVSGDKRHIGELTTGDVNLTGNMVLLIDDLITKADSKFEAIKSLEDEGASVKDVIVLVDRQQGGREQLEAAGYRLHAVFTLSQLLAFYVENDRIDQVKADEVWAYIDANS